MRTFTILLALTVACARPEPPLLAELYTGGDGTSCDQAVVINTRDHRRGIHAERDWLQRQQPGSRLQLQALHKGGSKWRSEEHTSELQSQSNLVCRLLLEKKKKIRVRVAHCLVGYRSRVRTAHSLRW